MSAPSLDDLPGWVPACAAFWLLGCTWNGWRRGLVREAVSLVALAAAVAAGFWLGPLIGPAIPEFGFPRFLKPVFGGVLVGTLLYGTIAMVSSIVFRKTDDQGIGMVRTLFGLSGALLGMLSGLGILALCMLGVRLMGSFADGLHKGAVAKAPRKDLPVPSPPELNPLATLKRLVDASPAAEWMARVDPVSPPMYARLSRAGQVLANAAARDKLFADPALGAVAKNPRLLAIKEDPLLQEALRSAELWTLLRSPKVQAAAADTQLVTALRALDLDAALARALNAPAPPQRPGALPASPTPAPAAPPVRRAKP